MSDDIKKTDPPPEEILPSKPSSDEELDGEASFGLGQGSIGQDSSFGDSFDSPYDFHDDFEDHERDFFERKIPARNMHWSVAWSDLMMTMFILFMVMFVYKVADREFLSGEGLGDFYGKEIGNNVVEDGPGGSQEFRQMGERAFTKIYDFSKLTSLDKDLKEFAEIDLQEDKTLRINLTGDLLFALGSTNVREDSFKMLEKIAVFLKETPYKINVVGHTDNLPIVGSGNLTNWELSANRAAAVVQYLIKATKLPPGQFYVTGHAEYRPVAPNDSPENRARNRRVEIIITKELPSSLPLGAADL